MRSRPRCIVIPMDVHLARGSLYPNLHKLQADGLIVGQWEEKETGRKRRYYHITAAGRAALAEKMQSWEELCRAVNRILEKSHGQA